MTHTVVLIPAGDMGVLLGIRVCVTLCCSALHLGGNAMNEQIDPVIRHIVLYTVDQYLQTCSTEDHVISCSSDNEVHVRFSFFQDAPPMSLLALLSWDLLAFGPLIRAHRSVSSLQPKPFAPPLGERKNKTWACEKILPTCADFNIKNTSQSKAVNKIISFKISISSPNVKIWRAEWIPGSRVCSIALKSLFMVIYCSC